jgi:hypothetical protein
VVVDVRRRTVRHHSGADGSRGSCLDLSGAQPASRRVEICRAARTDHADQLPTLVVDALGSFVLCARMAEIASGGLRSCTALGNCSRAGIATSWLTRASRKTPLSVASNGLKKSGCGSAAAATHLIHFPRSRAACGSALMSVTVRRWRASSAASTFLRAKGPTDVSDTRQRSAQSSGSTRSIRKLKTALSGTVAVHER